MIGLYILIAVGLLLLMLAAMAVCFYMTFYSRGGRVLGEDEFEFPQGKIYEPFYDDMRNWMREVRSMPHKEFSITTFDGLTLRGKYYEHEKGAPIEILFHGYRGTAERDLCGAVRRCFRLGRNALIVEQRAAGVNNGHVISFGINEHRDCLKWIDFCINHFGKDAKIIITGISMGATTVLLAAGEPSLPSNVIGVLADSGFSTAKEIIQKVIRQMHLPVFPTYALIRLSGRLFGGFDIEQKSAIEAMRSCKIPVIFFHGDADDFVPCDMSVRMYEACASEYKKLVKVPDAGHGLAYIIDKESYIQNVKDFDEECGFCCHDDKA